LGSDEQEERLVPCATEVSALSDPQRALEPKSMPFSIPAPPAGKPHSAAMFRWNFLFLVLLAGSMFSGRSEAIKTQPVDRIPEGHGLVVFTLSQSYDFQSNAQYFDMAPVAVTRIDVASSVTYYLAPDFHHTLIARIYAGALPAGRYRFVDLVAQNCGKTCKEPTFAPGSGLAEFTVVTGKASMLGTVMLSIDAAHGRQVAYTQAPRPLREFPRLKQWFPVLQQVEQAEVGWAPEQGGSERDLKFRLMKTTARSNRLNAQTSDGTIYLADMLGVLRRWKPGKPMESFDTGSELAIVAVAPSDDGNILVAYEDGTLRRSVDSAKTWAEVKQTLPDGFISDLFVDATGNYFAVLSVGGRAEIYKGTPDALQWTSMASAALKLSFTGAPGLLPQGLVQAGKLFVTAPSRTVLVHDMVNGESKTLPFPSAIGYCRPQATSWLQCQGSSGFGYNTYESHDDGLSWRKIKGGSAGLGATALKDENQGFSFADGKVLLTHDGGQSWQELAKSRSGFDVSKMKSPSAFYAVGGGMFLIDPDMGPAFSEDGGKSWISPR
jgi:hypothetical protein